MFNLHESHGQEMNEFIRDQAELVEKFMIDGESREISASEFNLMRFRNQHGGEEEQSFEEDHSRLDVDHNRDSFGTNDEIEFEQQEILIEPGELLQAGDSSTQNITRNFGYSQNSSMQPSTRQSGVTNPNQSEEQSQEGEEFEEELDIQRHRIMNRIVEKVEGSQTRHLQKTLAMLLERNQILESNVKDLLIRCENLDRTISMMKASGIDDRRIIKDRVFSQLRAQIKEYAESIQDKNNKLAYLVQEVQQLSSVNNGMKEAIQSEVDNIAKEIQKNQVVNESYKRKYLNQEDVLNKKDNEIWSLNSKISDMKEQLSGMQEIKLDHERALQEEKQRTSGAIERLNKIQEECEGLMDENRNIQLENQNLKEIIEQMKQGRQFNTNPLSEFMKKEKEERPDLIEPLGNSERLKYEYEINELRKQNKELKNHSEEISENRANIFNARLDQANQGKADDTIRDSEVLFQEERELLINIPETEDQEGQCKLLERLMREWLSLILEENGFVDEKTCSRMDFVDLQNLVREKMKEVETLQIDREEADEKYRELRDDLVHRYNEEISSLQKKGVKLEKELRIYKQENETLSQKMIEMSKEHHKKVSLLELKFEEDKKKLKEESLKQSSKAVNVKIFETSREDSILDKIEDPGIISQKSPKIELKTPNLFGSSVLEVSTRDQSTQTDKTNPEVAEVACQYSCPALEDLINLSGFVPTQPTTAKSHPNINQRLFLKERGPSPGRGAGQYPAEMRETAAMTECLSLTQDSSVQVDSLDKVLEETENQRDLKLKDLKEKLMTKSKSIEILSNKIKGLEEKIGKIKSEAALVTQRDTERHSLQVKALEDKLSTKNKDMRSKDKKNVELYKEVKNIKSQNKELMQENEELKKKLGQFRNKMNQDMKDIEKKMEEEEEKNRRQVEEFGEYIEEAVVVKQELHQVKEEMVELYEKAEKFYIENNLLSETLDQEVARSMSLSKENNFLKLTLKALEEQVQMIENKEEQKPEVKQGPAVLSSIQLEFMSFEEIHEVLQVILGKAYLSQSLQKMLLESENFHKIVQKFEMEAAEYQSSQRINQGHVFIYDQGSGSKPSARPRDYRNAPH